MFRRGLRINGLLGTSASRQDDSRSIALIAPGTVERASVAKSLHGPSTLVS